MIQYCVALAFVLAVGVEDGGAAKGGGVHRGRGGLVCNICRSADLLRVLFLVFEIFFRGLFCVFLKIPFLISI